MYECETLGCPNYVSVPDGYCLECTQRNDAEYDEDEDDYDPVYISAEHLCVKCGKHEAIINRVCGMCSELHPYMV